MDGKDRSEMEQRIGDALAARALETAATLAMRGYGPEICGYLRAVVRDEEAAAEVFSQFAEDLWRGIAGFRGDCSFRTWAYKLAWHAAARHFSDPYRRRKKRLNAGMLRWAAAAASARLIRPVHRSFRNRQTRSIRPASPRRSAGANSRLDSGRTSRDPASVWSTSSSAASRPRP